MSEKEIYKNGVALLEEWEDVNYCEHNFKFKDEWLTDKEVVDLLSQLNDENVQLKQALLFYLGIAVSESPNGFQNGMNKWCNILFNCDYEEAKRRYGDFEYSERWELE